jgi:UPF0755 protein
MDNPFYIYTNKLRVLVEHFIKTHHIKLRDIILSLCVLMFLFLYVFIATPPKSFPRGSIFTVEQGTGLLSLSKTLEQDKVIRSSFWFRIAVITFGGEHSLKSGDYALTTPQNVFTLAHRIVHAEHEIPVVRLTIPEGYTNKEIADLFDARFQKFDRTEFLALAHEGYMFPDTYFIEVSATASSTNELLRANFNKKIEPYLLEIDSSGHTLADIITMASVVEGEAKTLEDKRIIAGILWKRINLHMRLQVDSSPSTYKYSGLPPAPLSNPGLLSIEAALRPVSSPYIYFLTGSGGLMHYAKTFDEHKSNIQKYLK